MDNFFFLNVYILHSKFEREVFKLKENIDIKSLKIDLKKYKTDLVFITHGHGPFLQIIIVGINHSIVKHHNFHVSQTHYYGSSILSRHIKLYNLKTTGLNIDSDTSKFLEKCSI